MFIDIVGVSRRIQGVFSGMDETVLARPAGRKFGRLAY